MNLLHGPSFPASQIAYRTRTAITAAIDDKNDVLICFRHVAGLKGDQEADVDHRHKRKMFGEAPGAPFQAGRTSGQNSAIDRIAT